MAEPVTNCRACCSTCLDVLNETIYVMVGVPGVYCSQECLERGTLENRDPAYAFIADAMAQGTLLGTDFGQLELRRQPGQAED